MFPGQNLPTFIHFFLLVLQSGAHILSLAMDTGKNEGDIPSQHLREKREPREQTHLAPWPAPPRRQPQAGTPAFRILSNSQPTTEWRHDAYATTP